MKYTLNFTELGKDDAPIAGGKGASLGEMTQAGIPVPGGYVVLADTFDAFLQETDLVHEIDSILHEVNHEVIHTVEKASEAIQGLILSRPMPEAMQTEIQEKFQALGSQYVAVRSSATAEDGAEHAWAGQLDSFLNTTESDLIEKVRKCWASLFTPRAIFYRFEKGLHTTKISVAVVVQSMVNSEKSGIAFSVHPVTEDYNQLIIEAGFGLGEAIVSGSVTPNSYVVEKSPRNILDINVSEQGRAMYRIEGGGSEWQNLEPSLGNSQVLDETQIHELSDIIMRIEEHYGFPCDIEWAFESSTFYIVQSRPITTLTPKDPTPEDVTENEPNTESPKEGESSSFISPVLQDFNVDEWQYDGLWKNDLFATCFWQDCFVPEVVAELGIDLDRAGVMNLQGGHYLVHKPTRAIMDRQIKKMIDERNEAFFNNFVKVSNRIFKWGVEKGDSLSTEEPTLENFRDFVATAKKLNFIWLIAATYTNWPVEEKLGEAVVEDKFPPEQVLDVIPTIITPLYHYQKGLIELKKQIGGKTFAEVQQDKKIFDALQKHAGEYVWVETFNFIGETTTPEKLFNTISYLEEENHDQSSFDPKNLSAKLRFAANCMHDAGYVKQGGAEYFSIFSRKVIPFLERVAEKIGVTYREMMCLSTHEVEAALEGTLALKELTKRAKERIGVNNWTVIGGKGGEFVYIDEPADIQTLVDAMIPRIGEDTTELAGQIGNRGKYSGRVCVVMNTYDFAKLEAGDVLVTTMTTPDFIILMQKSGAIVTDIGGLLCHAAIVSRELGKPCIIGTKFATQMLHDGDIVEVDADNGVVRILKQKSQSAAGSETEKITFVKAYERDFTLALEEYWARGFLGTLLPKLGLRSPASAFEIFFVTEENMQIWENKAAIDWMLDELLKLNQEGTSFMESVIAEYLPILKDIEAFWKRGPLDDPKALQAYIDLLKKGAPLFSLWYYPGTDERTPKDVMKLVMTLREKDEFFARNDTYLKECIERLGGNRRYANLVLCDEFPHLPNPETLEKRANGIVSVDGRERSVMSLTEFAKAHPEYEFEGLFDSSEDVSEVSGQVAQKGKVQGRVRIVKNKFQMEEVAEGDILVSPMTTPDFISAMHRAAAFVTDEGGVMCHAAIVAREMQKPCIIGTKIATQVLKDGDLVEVDADNGLVRILEKKDSKKAKGEHFLEEAYLTLNKGKQLYPALKSYSAFMLGAGFHLKKYCEKWYGSEVSFDLLILMKEGFGEAWLPEEYMKFTSQIGLQEYIRDKATFKKRMAHLPERYQTMDSIYTENTYAQINQMSEEVLLVLLEEVQNLTWDTNAPTVCVNDVEKQMCWETLEYEGFGLTREEFDGVWDKASQPAFESIDKIQEKEFLNLLAKKASWSDILEACQYFFTNYHSAKTLSIVEDNLKQQYPDFLDDDQKVQQVLKQLSFDVEKITDTHQKWLESLSENKKDLAQYLYTVMVTRDRRKSFLNKGLTVMYRIAEEIFKREGIESNLIPYYTVAELLQGSKHLRQVKSELEKRKEGFKLLIEYSGEVSMSVEGIEQATERVNKYFIGSADILGENTAIIGQIGSRGNVQGRVRIVFDVQADHGFQNGEILVTGMTRPEFVPLMKKAAGIITNEGGITCHAAIVSRELGMPCVIGTKIATQALKDGDLVEVDADNGVVRIIKK